MQNRQDLLKALEADTVSTNSGLLVISIQDFQKFNRRYGFICGDSLLEQIYQRLVEHATNANSVFRVGGDEFAILIKQLSIPSLITLSASKLSDALQEDYQWQGGPVRCRCGIGISLMQISGDIETLLMDAERAALHAKKLRQNFYLFDKAQHKDDSESLELLKDLRDALENNDFELYYQPKIALKEQKGFYCEALIRWIHPTLGFIPPDRFLPLCDELGLNLPLSKWVINTALRQLSQWPKTEQQHVAVNLSADLIDVPDLIHIVSNALNIWNVKPEQLTIEITENAVIEDKISGFNNLSELQQLGVKISIDDFGTGYSSLEYFKNIPANELKIDRSFVQHLNDDLSDQKIVKLIVDLAHSFNLPVVAEGVEDSATLERIKSKGCEFAQGYYFSKPLPNSDYINWIETHY